MILISLPWPPTVNTYWRFVPGNKTPIISARGRAYRKAVATQIMIERHKKQPGKLKVKINAYCPDRRKRDLDNILKSLLDSLCHAGIYDDDSEIDDLHVVRCKVIKGGAVVVELSAING